MRATASHVQFQFTDAAEPGGGATSSTPTAASATATTSRFGRGFVGGRSSTVGRRLHESTLVGPEFGGNDVLESRSVNRYVPGQSLCLYTNLHPAPWYGDWISSPGSPYTTPASAAAGGARIPTKTNTSWVDWLFQFFKYPTMTLRYLLSLLVQRLTEFVKRRRPAVVGTR